MTRNVDGVLSSLVVHHLPGPAKQNLFAAICNRLSSRGGLLIADLVEAQHPKVGAFFADSWDQVTRLQSVAQTGSSQLFEKFKQARWNYYRFDDPADRPSPLFNQLCWLKEAGFATVDCFWMQAGHAIYGGYKTAANTSADGLPFEEILRITKQILSDE